MKTKITRLLFTIIILVIFYISNTSFSGGISGQSVAGCTCHGGVANPNTTVLVTRIPAAVTYSHGTTYNYTITVSNSTKVAGGFNLACNIGTLASTDPGVFVIPGGTEIRHNAPRALPATFTFTWTAPPSGNTVLQLTAAGNAVNLSFDNTGDQWNFATIAGVPLPVKFVSFNVTSKNENSADINWVTSEEENILKFDVEKSEDGKTFKTIASLDPVNKFEGNSYTFNDNNIVKNKKYYYRINNIDIDGKNKYSETKTLQLTSLNSAVTIYPTSIKNNELNFLNLNSNQNYEALIFDVKGSLVFKSAIANSKVDLNAGINKGFYFVVVNANGKKIATQKIIIE